MKRYEPEVNSQYGDMYEDPNGEWVKADIALELLEALEGFTDACDTAPPVEFIYHIGMACEKAKKVIAKTKGLDQ